MKYVYAAVYTLVLITQLPHIWYAYASLELPQVPLAQYTALGAAIAFELAIGVFTYRIIRGARRRWTGRGLAFFIVASVVANAFYYGWLPVVFDVLMPVFATLALPLGLALFAEEFGAEVRLDEQRARRAQRDTAPTQPEATETQSEAQPEQLTARERIIQLHRRNPDWTQAQLAQELGCHPSTVSRALNLTSEP